MSETCSRCAVAMEYQSREGSGFFAESWFCPCCRSRTRTPEMIEATGTSRASEMGMTRDEYHSYCASFISTRPLSPEAQAGLERTVKERAAAWTPTCEHDTNPWAAAPPSPEQEQQP